MITIHNYKRHDDWMAARKGGIGSSEVGTILGCNPYESRYQLWRRKKGIDGPKVETEAMANGHYLEEAVARYYGGKTEAQIIKCSAAEYIVENDLRDYLKVSPDRTFWLPNMAHIKANKGILECKSTTRAVDPEDVPQSWFCQLQYQMGAAEVQHGALAWVSSNPNLHFGHANFDFDADFFIWMLSELDEFWGRYIIGDEVPDASSIEDVMIRSPRSSSGKTVEATSEIADILIQLKQATDARKYAEGVEADLLDKVKLYMGDSEALTWQGQVLCTWKSTKDSTKFDWKRYQAEHADKCRDYMITTPGTRRFIIK